MDWRLFHGVYEVSLHHHWVGSFFSGVEKASIPVMLIATVLLWVFARPGGDRKWKLAAGSGLGAAALALAVNLVIHSLYDRPRPYEAHPALPHPWSQSTDASFPSDHASASLAIAFAVLTFDATIGAVFLVAALLIAVGRVFIGAHYPGDVLASLVVAIVSAYVVRVARPVIASLVRVVERATDPVIGRVYPKRATT